MSEEITKGRYEHCRDCIDFAARMPMPIRQPYADMLKGMKEEVKQYEEAQQKALDTSEKRA